jgi:CDP-glucose 4,6-dehydratase
MENMVEEETALFDNIYAGKRVFITGHTGFKGSWLAYWLKQLNAKIMGYSLPPPTAPNHFDLLDLDIMSIVGDIRDKDKLQQTLIDYQPDIVFHLAAQAIVRQSYQEPVETFTTNSLGTINVLEACRFAGSVKAVVAITSDKCYDNKEWPWAYRENDPIGGYDPYSASKGCAELIISCWRNSYFNLDKYGNDHQTLLASTRAGNVIGGGDWGPERLIPDIVKAAVKKEPVKLRNPHAIRPWQHVLEPLSGYLSLGQKLLEHKVEFSGAWNFGPTSQENTTTVVEIVESAKTVWPRIRYNIQDNSENLHETKNLRLDISKAQCELGWQPLWNLDKAVSKTIGWYKSYYEDREVKTAEDLQSFTAGARAGRSRWVSA